MTTSPDPEPALAADLADAFAAARAHDGVMVEVRRAILRPI